MSSPKGCGLSECSAPYTLARTRHRAEGHHRCPARSTVAFRGQCCGRVGWGSLLPPRMERVPWPTEEGWRIGQSSWTETQARMPRRRGGGSSSPSRFSFLSTFRALHARSRTPRQEASTPSARDEPESRIHWARQRWVRGRKCVESTRREWM